MIPLPQISVDSMSYLKPELLGLCAWLGLSNVYAGDRTRVLCHVAKHGVLDGLEPGLLSEEDRASTKAAHSDWLDYLAAIAPAPKAPAIVPPQRPCPRALFIVRPPRTGDGRR